MLAEGIRPRTLPGIQDITKQYSYQLAYQPFIRAHGFKPGTVSSCLRTERKCWGKVSMGMLGELVTQLLGKEDVDGMKGLQDIQVRFLPVSEAYKCYLTGEPFRVSRLRLNDRSSKNSSKNMNKK